MTTVLTPRKPSPAVRVAAAQATRETLVAVVVVIGVIGVGALWWRTTPAGSLHTAADELTAAGRLTGLVGTYLSLVEMLLMARIPWLERLVGMERLALWHRRNGEYVVSLLVAHAGAVIVGYALADHLSVMRETADLVLRYPDMLAATVALGLFVTVGIVSARAVRRRMAYHTWYFLHLYVYLAAVLAFAHEFATGDQFATHPLSRIVWAAMNIAVAVLVLVYRVGLPVRRALRHRIRVADVVVEGPGVVSVHLAGRRLDDLRAEPGQFFEWRFVDRRRWWQSHPFSLSAPPTDRRLRITVKALGDHTSDLATLRRGTRVVAAGPFGSVTPRRRTRRKVLLVAGGIGVAPLRSLVETLPATPGDVTFLYRASTEDDLVLRHELEAIARERAIRLAYVVGPRLPDPLTPAAFRRAIPDVADHDVFVCGPPGFVDHVIASLHRAGVPRRHLHAERFEF